MKRIAIVLSILALSACTLIADDVATGSITYVKEARTGFCLGVYTRDRGTSVFKAPCDSVAAFLQPMPR